MAREEEKRYVYREPEGVVIRYKEPARKGRKVSRRTDTCRFSVREGLDFAIVVSLREPARYAFGVIVSRASYPVGR